MKKFEMALASAFGVFVCIIVYRSVPWDYLLIKDSVAIIVSGLFGILVAAVLTDTRELIQEVKKAVLAMPSVKKLFKRGFPTMDYDSVSKCFWGISKSLGEFFRWAHSWVWIVLSNTLAVLMVGATMYYFFGTIVAEHSHLPLSSSVMFSVSIYGMLVVLFGQITNMLSSIVCFGLNIQLPLSKVNEWFRRYEYFSFFIAMNVYTDKNKSVFLDTSRYTLSRLEKVLRKYFLMIPATAYTILLGLYAVICLSALITAFIVEIPVMLINLSMALATRRRMAVMEGVLAGYAFSFWQETGALWVLVSMVVGVLVTLVSYELRQRKINDVWTRLWLLPACINPSQRVCGL